MNKNIYLVDTIGIETGMHKYDEAFYIQAKKLGYQVSIASNYANCDFIFYNYYKGSKVSGIWHLIEDLICFSRMVISHRESIFIYQSFGYRTIDIFFSLILIAFAKKWYLLVHDLYELSAQQKEDKKKAIKNYLYSRYVQNYICHSKSVFQEIEKFNDLDHTKKILYTPHLEYQYDTSFNEYKICAEIKKTLIFGKINVLFFGQVSLTKGIDNLIDCLPILKKNINIIVAGIDKTGLLKDVPPRENFHIVNRYIKDDELNYLFSKTDAVVLPYKKIFQSGVLETVIHFRKPAIISNLESFQFYLSKYPSFGIMLEKNTPENLASKLNSFTQNQQFYNDHDLEQYYKDHNLNKFLKEL